MASKNTWECEHGCKNTSVPCPHLEKLITPRQKWGTTYQKKILFTDDLGKFERQMVSHDPGSGAHEEIEELRDKLQGYILTIDEETAILSRLGLNETYRDLAIKLGCSRTRAHAIYKQAITKLKTQGYK